MHTQTIEFVAIEQPPLIGPKLIRAEYFELPTAFDETLTELIATVDETRCAGCGTPVGYYLTGWTDREHPIWRITYLARIGEGPISAVCDSCAPYVPEAP